MKCRAWLIAAKAVAAIAAVAAVSSLVGDVRAWAGAPPARAPSAASIGGPVLVSPPGHVVAEFRAATSPLDPQVMVATAMDSDASPFTRCAVYVSGDGGGHWSEVPVWPTEARSDHGGDPWVTIDANGVIHATCVMATRPQSVLYTNSHDQGQTWAAPGRVTALPASVELADKDALAVDEDGTVFVCFAETLSHFGSRTLVVARSDDQGEHWTAHDTGVDALCNGIATTPEGRVNVVFVAEQPQGLVYGTVTSNSDGDSWQAPNFLGPVSATNFQLPAITREANGEAVVAAVAGSAEQQIEIAVETADGQVTRRFSLPNPPSATCASGRLIQPALTAAPTGSASLQVACKLDPTTSQSGRMEVWLYENVYAAPPAPIEVTSIDLPAGRPPSGRFAKRFADGGDYWSLTWISGGLFSMWIDPADAGGPGPLLGVAVSG
jgi:hypothetical protein